MLEPRWAQRGTASRLDGCMCAGQRQAWYFFTGNFHYSWLLEPLLSVASCCQPISWLGYAGALLSCCQLTSWLRFTVMKAGCWSEIHVNILSWLAPSVAVFYWQFFSLYMLEPSLGVASCCHPISWLHFTEIKIECVSEMTR